MVSCDVGGSRGSDPVLLWLCRRLAGVAPIGPLAWKHPYVACADLKKKKKERKKEMRKWRLGKLNLPQITQLLKCKASSL